MDHSPGVPDARRGAAPSALARVGQGVAIVVALAAGVVSVLLAVLVLGSLGAGEDRDPHGYVLIFGSVLLVPTSVVGALALPFVVGPARLTARRWLTWGALAWVLGACTLAGIALFSG